MTDIPANLTAVPSRLGSTALVDERGLVIELEPQAEALHQGVVRLSVISFIVDVVAGVTLDTDPDAWTFTTDLTLRMRPVPASQRLTATGRILRQGKRSAHTLLSVVDETGAEVAAGAIGFAHVPRKPTDPPKIIVSPESLVDRFRSDQLLTAPLREEAGIVPIDPSAGVVEMAVRPEVCNPAGTIQGAMVALVAEAATEDLMASMGEPSVVTDLDIRYLGQANIGPVRTRCRLLGSGPCPPVEVEIVDLADRPDGDARLREDLPAHRRVTAMLDHRTFAAVADELVDGDPALAAIVADHGMPPFWSRPAGFRSLVLLILEQQVSLASGAAAYRRLRDRVRTVTPANLLACSPEELREDGISRQKDRYLRALSAAVEEGTLDLDALEAMDDDAVRRALVALPGIGPWTADVYLLACLGRPDLWPVGDRALQVAVAEALGLAAVPTPVALEPLGERWRPHRSTAARILWHGYLGRRGRVETPGDLLDDLGVEPGAARPS